MDPQHPLAFAPADDEIRVWALRARHGDRLHCEALVTSSTPHAGYCAIARADRLPVWWAWLAADPAPAAIRDPLRYFLELGTRDILGLEQEINLFHLRWPGYLPPTPLPAGAALDAAGRLIAPLPHSGGKKGAAKYAADIFRFPKQRVQANQLRAAAQDLIMADAAGPDMPAAPAATTPDPPLPSTALYDAPPPPPQVGARMIPCTAALTPPLAPPPLWRPPTLTRAATLPPESDAETRTCPSDRLSCTTPLGPTAARKFCTAKDPTSLSSAKTFAAPARATPAPRELAAASTLNI
jgi:hypothetical protein